MFQPPLMGLSLLRSTYTPLCLSLSSNDGAQRPSEQRCCFGNRHAHLFSLRPGSSHRFQRFKTALRKDGSRSGVAVRADQTGASSSSSSSGDGDDTYSGEANGAFRHLWKKGGDLFKEERVGAEYGEGFATFRPRGPLHVDVDFLNDRMKVGGLQRIRYAMKPDEAFGLVYSWDNVVADTKSIRLEAWRKLAEHEGRGLPEDPEVLRQLGCAGAERVIRQELCWTRSEGEIKRLTDHLARLYCDEFVKVAAPMAGVREWLKALDKAGVPCAVASSMDRLSLLAALDRMGLRNYFRAFVTEEDGMESIAHRFLSAAVKLDRAPAKCVVFEDDPQGITAAHNCTMKAVALIGAHPAYELVQADLTVSSYMELSVINLRKLFANKGEEFMDLQKQPDDKKPRRRKNTNDMMP